MWTLRATYTETAVLIVKQYAGKALTGNSEYIFIESYFFDHRTNTNNVGSHIAEYHSSLSTLHVDGGTPLNGADILLTIYNVHSCKAQVHSIEQTAVCGGTV